VRRLRRLLVPTSTMRSWLNKVVQSTKKRTDSEVGSNENLSYRSPQYGSKGTVAGEDHIKAQLISRSVIGLVGGG